MNLSANANLINVSQSIAESGVNIIKETDCLPTKSMATTSNPAIIKPVIQIPSANFSFTTNTHEEIKNEIDLSQLVETTLGSQAHASFMEPEDINSLKNAATGINKEIKFERLAFECTTVPKELEGICFSLTECSKEQQETYKQYFSTQSTLGEKSQAFKCTECDYQFSQKCHLKHHILSVHEGLKPFKCSQCSYQCAKKGCLKRHISLVHDKIQPFKCNRCDYHFSQKSHLKQHIMSVHERIKPFKCHICSYECSKNGCLKRHIALVHEKIQPSFICTNCGYEFSQKCHLKQHVLSVHEGLKPFKCLLCDYQCAKKGSLKRHMSVHNRN